MVHIHHIISPLLINYLYTLGLCINIDDHQDIVYMYQDILGLLLLSIIMNNMTTMDFPTVSIHFPSLKFGQTMYCGQRLVILCLL